MVKACEGMLERMDSKKDDFSRKNNQRISHCRYTEYMREGLLLAGEHYGDIDTEPYRLNIMNALDIAEDKVPYSHQIILLNKFRG